MSNKPESNFRKRIKPTLDSLPNTILFSIQQSSIRGTPDILACINGNFVALELKASMKSKVSELQKYNLERITNKGLGYAFLVFPENWEIVLKKLKQLANGESKWNKNQLN